MQYVAAILWVVCATFAIVTIWELFFRLGKHMADKKKSRKPEPPPLPDPVITAIGELRRAFMEKISVEFDTVLERLDKLDADRIDREAAVNRAVGELSSQMLDVLEAVKEHHAFEDCRHKVAIERDEAVDLVLAEVLETVRKRLTINLRLTNGTCATAKV